MCIEPDSTGEGAYSQGQTLTEANNKYVQETGKNTSMQGQMMSCEHRD